MLNTGTGVQKQVESDWMWMYVYLSLALQEIVVKFECLDRIEWNCFTKATTQVSESNRMFCTTSPASLWSNHALISKRLWWSRHVICTMYIMYTHPLPSDTCVTVCDFIMLTFRSVFVNGTLTLWSHILLRMCTVHSTYICMYVYCT